MPEQLAARGPLLLPSMLPSGDIEYFKDTSFFSRGIISLPTPEEIRHLGGTDRPGVRPPPLVIPSLNLIVKYGLIITIAEGQCLWALRHLLPSVPVPEIFGWCLDQGQTFLYIQLIEGMTLEHAWPELDLEEKYEICVQLSAILQEIRGLRQDPYDPFIGSINRQPIRDIIFEGRWPPGVFRDSESLHEWFVNLSRRPLELRDQNEAPNPWRIGLQDDTPVVFTHGDLHRSNIMMSRDTFGSPYISGLIDWHQSGWYPAAWEYYKTRFTCKGTEMWEIDFILEFLESYKGFISWSHFAQCIGS